MAAVRIVPCLDEVEDGCLGLTLRTKAVLDEQRAFERSVEALAHRVIVTVAGRTHVRRCTCALATLTEGDGRVLRALIRVVNHSERFAAKDGHLERADDQLFAHMVGHRPADDATAEDVENDGELQEAAPRRNVSDVGDPQLIGSIGGEAATGQVRRWLRVTIADRGNDHLAARLPLTRRPGIHFRK